MGTFCIPTQLPPRSSAPFLSPCPLWAPSAPLHVEHSHRDRLHCPFCCLHIYPLAYFHQLTCFVMANTVPCFQFPDLPCSTQCWLSLRIKQNLSLTSSMLRQAVLSLFTCLQPCFAMRLMLCCSGEAVGCRMLYSAELPRCDFPSASSCASSARS